MLPHALYIHAHAHTPAQFPYPHPMVSFAYTRLLYLLPRPSHASLVFLPHTRLHHCLSLSFSPSSLFYIIFSPSPFRFSLFSLSPILLSSILPFLASLLPSHSYSRSILPLHRSFSSLPRASVHSYATYSLLSSLLQPTASVPSFSSASLPPSLPSSSPASQPL